MGCTKATAWCRGPSFMGWDRCTRPSFPRPVTFTCSPSRQARPLASSLHGHVLCSRNPLSSTANYCLTSGLVPALSPFEDTSAQCCWLSAPMAAYSGQKKNKFLSFIKMDKGKPWISDRSVPPHPIPKPELSAAAAVVPTEASMMPRAQARGGKHSQEENEVPPLP